MLTVETSLIILSSLFFVLVMFTFAVIGHLNSRIQKLEDIHDFTTMNKIADTKYRVVHVDQEDVR